jgi:hypothetical protein
MDLLFPEYRLDWFGAGPSSPNKTGALLAILFVASWWPALRYRWGFWLSLPVAFVAAGLLLQTESRGALVGAGVGVVLLVGYQFTLGSCCRTLAKASRYVLALRGLSLLIASSILALYSHQIGVNERMAAMTSGEDGSSNVRVALYSAGLQMIADAPLGWGAGRAGDAYGQWYQVIGDDRSYLSLVNSHLTWMAEYGMVFQVLYIAGWGAVLLLCWPVDVTRAPLWRATQGATGIASLRLITFAAWVTLGICGFFSSVLTLVWLWVLPCLLLAFCIVQRVRAKQWPSRRQGLAASFSVMVAFVGLHATAYELSGSVEINASAGRIEAGKMPQAVALVQPDRLILGDKYGHTIREYLDDIGGVTILRDVPDQEIDLASFDKVVLSGNADRPTIGKFGKRVIWMNPPAEVGEAALEQLKGHSLTILIGRLGNWRRLRMWQSLVDEDPNWNLIELRGVADFIPNWPRYLIAKELE